MLETPQAHGIDTEHFDIGSKSLRLNDEGFLNNNVTYKELIEQSQITEIEEIKKPESTRDGEIRRVGFRTEAGYAYSSLIGVPFNPTNEIPVMFTSAWLTSTEGHNEHTARNLMRLGNMVMLVGAEGSWHNAGHRFTKPNISLSGSAAAMLNFTDYISHEYKYIIDRHKRLLIGESRGAMVGMGALALDKYFNQEIKFADLTAPCFPRKFKARDSLLLASQVLQEPVSTFKFINRLTLSKLIHSPSTLDLNLYSFGHQVAIGPALFSGEAGEMASKIDKDKMIHITCFNNDKASMLKHWKRIFKDYSNVHIVPLEGGHLSLADPETLAYILGRNTAFQELNTEKGDNIESSELYLKAHKIVSNMKS